MELPEPTTRFAAALLALSISEACGLKREHAHLKDSHPWIHIAKGKSKYAKRDIRLTARAVEAAKEALKQSRCDYVFTSKGGRKPLTRHYPSELFRLVRDAVNMDHGTVLHSTRHTFCTRLGKAGADAFTIQKLAGHSSITIFQRYVHSDRAIKNAAIALLEKVEQKAAEEAPKQEASEEEVIEI